MSEFKSQFPRTERDDLRTQLAIRHRVKARLYEAGGYIALVGGPVLGVILRQESRPLAIGLAVGGVVIGLLSFGISVHHDGKAFAPLPEDRHPNLL